jgi:hypothetical protein
MTRESKRMSTSTEEGFNGCHLQITAAPGNYNTLVWVSITDYCYVRMLSPSEKTGLKTTQSLIKITLPTFKRLTGVLVSRRECLCGFL